MNALRFSVTGLLAMVAFVAVGFGALLNAGPLWESAMFSAATACLVVASLLAWLTDQPKKTFWSGAACCGWVYWVLAFVPAVHASERLVTTQLLRWAYSAISQSERERRALSLIPPGASIVARSNEVIEYALPDGRRVEIDFAIGLQALETAATIGHSMFTIVAAFFGGVLALGLYRKRGTTRHSGAL